MLAVEQKDGHKQLVWRQDTLRTSSSFQPTEQVVSVDIDSVIYLRATVTYSTSKTRFYYSLDNKTYRPIGGQTTLGYNLSVFVGARFGLFCYASQPDSEGYADFDWFSTESEYDESTFYPEHFEGFSEDMLTVQSLNLDKEEMEIMIGKSSSLQINATYRDGHTENIAAQAKFEVAAPDIVLIQNGQLRGLAEGRTEITATYTDPMGNELKTTFNVRSTFFPFGAEYINPSLFAQGVYTESTRTFRPGQWGQMGWEYPDGADMSAYKYLVIKLTRPQNCDAHLNIFTANSIWSDCCESPGFGSKKQIVINLSTAKYTSGGRKGQALDTKNIRIVSFWSNGQGTIAVDDMYLTNNEDYSPGQPTGVSTLIGTEDNLVDVYSVSGILVRSKVQRSQALQGLPSGIYLVGGKKMLAK